MKYIVAIDQGTTGSRAIAYDTHGKAIASAYREFRQYFPKPGWVEHDPEEIWQSVNSCLQKVVRILPKNSVEAIGITNQRETAMVWDARTGKPVHNAIVWQCRRTSERCSRLLPDKVNLIRRCTGLPADPYFSATKIEWLLNNVRDCRREARRGNLRFGTPDTWVLHKLTGGRVHATDLTNASRTMLFNIGSLHWEKALLDMFGIPAEILPRVLPSSGVFGKTVKIGNLPAGIPVSGIAGDQQAALFGQACFDPGEIKNTYGTGAFLLMNTGRKRIDSRRGLISTLACSLSPEPVYCLEGSIFIAGAAIQWLRDGLRIMDSAAESEKMAMAVKDNGGVYFVPALTGLGAPYWDRDCRGAVYGLTRGTGREHLARAALEAVCYQVRDVLSAMRADSGLPIRDLRVDGGASSNDFLCRFQSDILGVKVVRPQAVETTSLGAAYLAGLAVGYWKDTGQIKSSRRPGKTFKPSMPEREAARLYAGWQAAVERTLTR